MKISDLLHKVTVNVGWKDLFLIFEIRFVSNGLEVVTLDKHNLLTC